MPWSLPFYGQEPLDLLTHPSSEKEKELTLPFLGLPSFACFASLRFFPKGNPLRGCLEVAKNFARIRPAHLLSSTKNQNLMSQSEMV